MRKTLLPAIACTVAAFGFATSALANPPHPTEHPGGDHKKDEHKDGEHKDDHHGGHRA